MDQQDKSIKDANEAQAKVDAARAKLNDDGSPKTKEQLDIEKLQADADAKRAKAAEEGADANAPAEARTVAQAGTLVIADDGPDMDSGHWRAQKFGNDPSNPQPAKGEHTDPDLMTVKLTRKTPDLIGAVQMTMVHPEMVGDYERAGWNRA